MDREDKITEAVYLMHAKLMSSMGRVLGATIGDPRVAVTMSKGPPRYVPCSDGGERLLDDDDQAWAVKLRREAATLRETHGGDVAAAIAAAEWQVKMKFLKNLYRVVNDEIFDEPDISVLMRIGAKSESETEVK